MSTGSLNVQKFFIETKPNTKDIKRISDLAESKVYFIVAQEKTSFSLEFVSLKG